MVFLHERRTATVTRININALFSMRKLYFVLVSGHVHDCGLGERSIGCKWVVSCSCLVSYIYLVSFSMVSMGIVID